MITEATFVFYTVCLYSDSDFKSSYIARDFFKKGLISYFLHLLKLILNASCFLN